MTATTAPASPASSTQGSVARLPLRPSHLLAGTALTALAITLAATWDTGVSSVLLFALLPDAALLLAIGGPMQQGRLPTRAVPAYNVLHHPVVPAVLLALAMAGALGHYWLVAALAWGAHIAFDRGFGYGLRTADGWQRA
jgi:hypothetical protein